MLRLVLLFLLLPSLAAAELVLPPTALEPLRQALSGLGPELVFAGLAIDRDAAGAKVCRPDGSCLEVRLTHASTCAVPSGAFCLAAEARPGELERVAAAVKGIDPWKKPTIAEPILPPWVKPFMGQPIPPPPQMNEGSAPTAATPSNLPAYALALALVLGPLVAGAALGWLARRLGRIPWRGLAALGLLGGSAVVWLLPNGLGIGLWDGGWILVLLGAGFALGARPPGRGTLALGGVSLLLTLGVLELGSRLLLPPAPVFPAPRYARFVLAEILYEDSARGALYPDSEPFYAQRTRHVAGPRRVLHIGDSMIDNHFTERGTSFVARLNRLQPGVAHVNAGVAGTDLDFYLLVLRAWAPRLHPQLVVIYFFLGNDGFELDHRYRFCPEGLLDMSVDPPRARCPTPRRPMTSRLCAPAPYVLRVATGFSVFARHATAVLGVSGRPPYVQSDIDPYLAAIAAEARAQRVELLVVTLPERSVLEGRKGGREPADVHAALDRAGIRWIDATPVIEAVAAAEGIRAVFLNDPPGDVHFDTRGHEVLSSWLAENLPRPQIP